MSLTLEILAGAIFAILLMAGVRKSRFAPPAQILGFSLVIAALIYVGFAGFGIVAGKSDYSWVTFEMGGLVFYSVFAYLGMRASPWYLAAGWALHVMWDISFHTDALYVPSFYPGICIGFDVVVAVFAVYLSAKLGEN